MRGCVFREGLWSVVDAAVRDIRLGAQNQRVMVSFGPVSASGQQHTPAHFGPRRRRLVQAAVQVVRAHDAGHRRRASPHLAEGDARSLRRNGRAVDCSHVSDALCITTTLIESVPIMLPVTLPNASRACSAARPAVTASGGDGERT